MKNQISQIQKQCVDINKDVATWRLPNGAIARLGRGSVNDLAISQDRKYFAVGTDIGVWVYDYSMLVPIALWDTERGMVTTVDFSPNESRWLVTGNADGILKVWDLHRGIRVSRMKYSEGKSDEWRDGISRVAFSGDGQYIAASVTSMGVIYIWHSETGEQISRCSATPDIKIKWRGLRRPLCFSDDGCFLACASPADAAGTVDCISVWHVTTGEHVASFNGNTAQVLFLTFSPCGRYLAAGDMSGILREWCVTTGNQTRVFSKYAEKYWMVPSYLPSGALRAAGVGKTDTAATFVWDVERHEKLKTFKLPASIGSIRFSKGTSLAFARAAEINLWDVDMPHAVAVVSTEISFPACVTFSPDGETLLTAGTGPVTCWDVLSKKQSRRLISRVTTKTPVNTETKVHSVYISPSGNVDALGSARNMLYVWNLETHQTIDWSALLQESVPFAARPGEQGADLDSRLYVWDRQGNHHTLIGHTAHEEYVQAAVFSPTGEKWASGDYDGKLYVWDRHGNQRNALIGHTATIKALAFAPDGKRLVSASNDETVRVWNVASGAELISLSLTQLNPERYNGDLYHKQEFIEQQRERRERGDKPARPEIGALAFSPRGDIIAGGLYGEIRLWDAKTYEVLRAILPPLTCRRQFALAFSPCGYFLASGAWWDGTEKVSIRLWEVATGENIVTFWGHSTDVQDIAFSPDGTLLASGSFDGTVLLWDVTLYLHHKR
ncbi:hypothetical protein F4X88_09130 [Candidatus Poribacteria bacterium]|nr:hypothetical protein [Candidatus Poribacteria bacterium]MYA56444.1 hypothetical protein [Candidatus Poribacteria bacterium]